MGDGKKGLSNSEFREFRKAATRAWEMIGLTRSSSQEVADGYGPSIQKSELAEDARRQGYRMGCIRDIVEPATIDLEERDLFNEVVAEAIALK